MTRLTLRLVRGILVTGICALPLIAGGTASAAPAPQPCSDSPGLCGSIDVPLDRANPLAGTTAIGFTLLPQGDASVASQGTILAIAGGPGISSTSDSARSASHVRPAIWAVRSAAVKSRLAAVREWRRPAPWEQEFQLSGLPLPATM